jgi:hypothetical protein
MLEANGYEARLLSKIRHQKRKEETELQNHTENNHKNGQYLHILVTR